MNESLLNVVQTVVQPVFVCVSLLLSIPIWNLLRRKVPARLVELDLHVPPRVDNVHLKRAFLNVFLFLYAPLTRLSIEAFVCRDTCSETADTADCGPRLVFDLSVACYEGEHLAVVGMSIGVLASMVLVLPTLILLQVRRTRKKRDASLKLRGSDVERWFNELDKDEVSN